AVFRATEDLRDALGAETASYQSFLPRYAELRTQIETLRARAAISSRNDRVCQLPRRAHDWLRGRVVPELPTGLNITPTDDERETGGGCTLRLVEIAQSQLSDFETIHYCAQDSADNDPRCPYGRTILNAAAIETARAAWLQSIDIAWA